MASVCFLSVHMNAFIQGEYNKFRTYLHYAPCTYAVRCLAPSVSQYNHFSVLYIFPIAV
jgi:hypothetical protein